MDEKDQRRHTRFQINRPGLISVNGALATHAQVVNISESGVALLYSAPIAPAVELEISLHVNIGGQRVQIRQRGHARHCRQQGSSYVIGVQFIEVTPRELDTLRRLVEINKLKAS